MRSLVRGAVALGALALGGCAANHYRVSMTPVPGGLRRETACWAEAKTGKETWRKVAFPADRLRRVARAYGKPVPESGEGTHVFEGIFADAMPDDVGGAGFVARAPTSLGSVWRYAERFGGDSDPLAEVERRFRAADRMSEFLVAWFGHEMEGTPGWDRLKTFLQGPLRRDLKNLALLDGSLAERSSEDGWRDDVAVALRLFLRERGYVRSAEFDREGLGVTGRVVARWMGVPDADPVPASLSFLEEDRLDASMQAASSSPVVQRLWRERAAESPEPPSWLSADEAARDLFLQLAFVDLLDVRVGQERDVVEVSLACGVAPTETNGEWRADEGRVTWPVAAVRSRSITGLLRHATWAVPDEDAQRARFGGVLLAGETLQGYVEWRLALSAEDGPRWDAAIAALTPGEGLVRAIDAIRWTGADDQDATAAGRSILLEALAAVK